MCENYKNGDSRISCNKFICYYCVCISHIVREYTYYIINY